MDLILDINQGIYPVDLGDKFRLVLASSLRSVIGDNVEWSLAWTEMTISIYISINLSIYLSNYLSICREDGFADQGDWSPLDSGPSRADSFEYVMHGKIYRWVYLDLYMSYLFFYISFRLFVFLSIYILSFRLSIFPFVYLSVHLSFRLSIFLCIWRILVSTTLIHLKG